MAKKKKKIKVWWIDTSLNLKHTFMPKNKAHYGIFINKKDAEWHRAAVADVAMTVHN